MTGNQAAYTRMQWATVYLTDDIAPQITNVRRASPANAPDAGLAPNEQWQNGAASTSVFVDSTDVGVGMRGITVTGATSPSIAFTNQCNAPLPCSKGEYLSYTRNEGINTITATPVDKAGKIGTPRTWTEKSDRTPPTITPTGTLYDARDGRVGPDRGDFTLSIKATDGSPSSPSAYRSGATQVTATLDDRPMTNSPASAPCTRPEGSCELSLTTTLTAEQVDDLDAGVHTVRMTATDAAGNTTPVQSFSFTYDPEEPIVEGADGAGASDLRYTGAASCSSLPPTAPTIVNVAASTAQTVAQAIQTVQSVLPAAVRASTTAATAALTPRLQSDSLGSLSTGSLTGLRVFDQLERGFALGNGAGGVCFTPARVSDQRLTGSLTNAGAMVFANSDRATTTVLRPTATGAETLTVLNDESAPRSVSWRVNAGEGRRLVTLDDGSIAVVNPGPATVTDPEFLEDTRAGAVNAGLDQLEPDTPVPTGDAAAQAAAVGNTASELAKAHDAFARAQNSTLDEILLVIPKPWALDATGRAVPATLSIEGTTITMTVTPPADATFPIVADPAPSASAARRGGSLRLMTFNLRSGRPNRTLPPQPSANRDDHVAHARRAAAVIYNQLRSRSVGREVAAFAGLQEACELDLREIEAELNRRSAQDGSFGIQWRANFRSFRSNPQGCPDYPAGSGRTRFGNATITNVGRNFVYSKRFGSQRPEGTRPSDLESRGFMRAQVDVAGRNVELFTTHLIANASFRVNDTHELTIQDEQSRELLQVAEPLGAPRAVVGDFNAQPDRPAVQRWLTGGFREANRCRQGQTFPECGQPTLGDGISDYIFTRGLGVNGGRVANVDDATSDHEALVASTQVP